MTLAADKLTILLSHGGRNFDASMYESFWQHRIGVQGLTDDRIVITAAYKAAVRRTGLRKAGKPIIKVSRPHVVGVIAWGWQAWHTDDRMKGKFSPLCPMYGIYGVRYPHLRFGILKPGQVGFRGEVVTARVWDGDDVQLIVPAELDEAIRPHNDVGVLTTGWRFKTATDEVHVFVGEVLFLLCCRVVLIPRGGRIWFHGLCCHRAKRRRRRRKRLFSRWLLSFFPRSYSEVAAEARSETQRRLSQRQDWSEAEKCVEEEKGRQTGPGNGCWSRIVIVPVAVLVKWCFTRERATAK